MEKEPKKRDVGFERMYCMMTFSSSFDIPRSPCRLGHRTVLWSGGYLDRRASKQKRTTVHADWLEQDQSATVLDLLDYEAASQVHNYPRAPERSASAHRDLHRVGLAGSLNAL